MMYIAIDYAYEFSYELYYRIKEFAEYFVTDILQEIDQLN